ncbi:MAG: YdcH family protein [Sphingobium sp.]
MSREDIMRRLELLRVEHRDLDGAIGALIDSNSADQMQIARLKKRKLRLRDEMVLLEDELVPDIIA